MEYFVEGDWGHDGLVISKAVYLRDGECACMVYVGYAGDLTLYIPSIPLKDLHMSACNGTMAYMSVTSFRSDSPNSR